MSNIVFGTTPGNWNVGANWVGGTQPGTGDTAVFTATSASCTIPAATAVTVGAVDFTGLGVSSYAGTFTFAATTSVLTIGSSTLGACTFVAGMTLTLTGLGTINFVATTASTTYQLKTAGLTMPNITINIGTTTKLQSADGIIMGNTTVLTLTQGNFDTNNQSTHSWGLFSSSNSNTRSFLMGSSIIAINGTGTVFDTTTSTGLTVNVGTSTVNFTGANQVIISGGGATTEALWNVSATGSGAFQLSRPMFCNNFTRVSTATKGDSLILGSAATPCMTATGVVILTGNSTTNRLLVRGVFATQKGIALGTTGSIVATNVDFEDIGVTGTNTPVTGTSLGDAQGNSGITFDTPVSQIWSGNATGNWSDVTKWTSRVPLPQDNVSINALTSGTITADMPRMGANIDFTGSTGGTLSFSSTGVLACGNWTNVASLTISGIQTLTLGGRGTQTFTSAGVVFSNQLSFLSAGGSYTLQDALANTRTSIVFDGIFNANGFNVTSPSFNPAGVLAAINMGSGTWMTTATTGNVWSASTLATINPGTSTIVIANASTSTRTFGGGGLNYNNVTYTVANSPGALAITGANTFNTLNVSVGTMLTMPSSTTNTFNSFDVNGQNNGYLYLPGVTGNYVSTPSSSALQITGDLDLRALVAPTSWTPAEAQEFIGRSPAAGSRSYQFTLNASTGLFQLQLSPDGTAVTSVNSTVATGFAPGFQSWVRATWQQSSGHAQFFTSPDGVTWTQLGTTQTLSVASIFPATGILELGTEATGTSNLFIGNVYRAQVYNGIAGTLVFDANFATKPFGANNFTESSTNAATVTINGTLAQCGDGRVMLNSSTPGTQATLFKQAGSVAVDYLLVQDSKATGVAWYAGTNSTNVSNNTGWSFGASATSPGGFFGVWD